MLPDELRGLLAEQAHRRGISAGALIRKALMRELAQGGSGPDAFLNDPRVAGGSTPKNVAEKHDAYLYGEKP
jgi:hypothetical protein